MLKGSLVAIVTPMHEDGSLDLARFRSLIDFHVQQGTDGIVVVGTTGESPTVDFDEHHLLIRTAVEHANRRISIIAGTGANSTREAIELAAYAKQAGADMSLSVVPYYNQHKFTLERTMWGQPSPAVRRAKLDFPRPQEKPHP